MTGEKMGVFKDGKYSKEIVIPISMCDFTERLSINDLAAIFMDMAYEDAERRGIGTAVMKEEHFFWLTVRTKFVFHKFPKALEKIKVLTWPNPFGSALCNRCYTMENENGERLASGITEWAIFDLETNRLIKKLSDTFLKQEVLPETPFEIGRLRIGHDFSGSEKLGTYKVRSTDIDIGNHMNNVAYIRALLSMLSTVRRRELDIKGLDISYRSPSFEDEELGVYIRKDEGFSDIGMLHSDGKPSVLARINY